MSGNEKNVVAYHRVSPTKRDRISTDGITKRPHAEIQKILQKSMVSSIELAEKEAERNGEQIEYHYSDEYISGKNTNNMVQFQQMMEDAKAGKISKIYIRRVNRFGRNLKGSLEAMVQLHRIDIPVIFIENHIDTSQPFMIPVMMMFVELAEQERESWEEARIAGVERALARGQKFGRKPVDINVKELRRSRTAPPAERTSWKELEELHSASRTTLIKKLKAAGYWDFERRCVV